MLLMSGCDESLPPREEPQQFLETSALGVSGTMSYRAGNLDGGGGSFIINVKNIYSEVLQDTERVRGDIEIWMRDMPEKRAAVQALKRDLTNPGLVFGNLLTLGPDTTATMLKRWEHRLTSGIDSGRFFWEFVDSTLKFVHGEPYYESDPVHFVASARVQAFKHVQAVEVRRLEFTVVYLRF